MQKIDRSSLINWISDEKFEFSGAKNVDFSKAVGVL